MITMKPYEAIGLAVILGLTALAGISCGKTQATTSQELNGVTWVLQSYWQPGDSSPTVAVEDKETTMTFVKEKMTVEGSGGVNAYGGDYVVNDNEIKITDMKRTLMAGSGPIMEQEDAFFKVLGPVLSYEIDGKQLTLSSDAGNLVFLQK